MSVRPFATDLNARQHALVTALLLSRVVSTRRLVVPMLRATVTLLLSVLIRGVEDRRGLVRRVPFSPMMGDSFYFLYRGIVPEIVRVPLVCF